MNGIVTFLKEYVGMFLIFTVVLYVIPSEQYRGYLRFFLEMVLVLFCVQQFLSLGNSNIKQTWENSYQSFYQEMEQRKQEAQDLKFLDEEYVAEFQTEEEVVP